MLTQTNLDILHSISVYGKELTKQKFNLSEEYINLIDFYLNDKNSSSLREIITYRSAGFNIIKTDKLGFDAEDETIQIECKPKNISLGSKEKLNLSGNFTDFTIYRLFKYIGIDFKKYTENQRVEIIAKLFPNAYAQVITHINSYINKTERTGLSYDEIIINDFKEDELKNIVGYKKCQILSSGFYDGEFIYCVGIPSYILFAKLAKKCFTKFPHGYVSGSYVRTASFSLNDLYDRKKECIIYHNKVSSKFEKIMTKKLFNFLNEK